MGHHPRINSLRTMLRIHFAIANECNLLVECLIPLKRRLTMYGHILLTDRLCSHDPISLSGCPLYTVLSCPGPYTGLFYLDCRFTIRGSTLLAGCWTTRDLARPSRV